MKAYKAFFATTSLCSALALAALAAPAWAQHGRWAAGAVSASRASPARSQPTQQTPPQGGRPAPAAAPIGEVVVTGSRIKTTNFNSPVAVDDDHRPSRPQLTGTVDTTQILQLSAVAANAVQINNFFTGFVTTGGPGVNTLSLRGLGAQRTLFLINGERLGPAGVGGTVGPFDLNVIPASMIDHIEILKDGASSIYGSDAVAGVVNIITKTNQDGGDAARVRQPVAARRRQQLRDINGSWGKTFAKGYVQAGFDYYQQDALTFGQRTYLNCSRRTW